VITMVGTLGNIYRQNRQLTTNIHERGDVPTVFNFAETKYLVRVISAKLDRKNIAGTTAIYGHPLFGIYGTGSYASGGGMVWGSTTQGVWGTNKWGNTIISFILGHAGAGVLGTATLGETVSDWVQFASQSLSQRIPNVGRTAFRDWLAGSGNTQPSWQAWGSGSTAFTLADTALESEESSGNRLAPTTATGAKQITFTREWNALQASGNDMREFGLFDVTGGTEVLYSRVVFPTALDKSTSEEARYTEVWEFTNTKPMMDAGIQVIRDWAAGSTTETAPIQMAWGSGSVGTAVTDTAMQGREGKKYPNCYRNICCKKG